LICIENVDAANAPGRARLSNLIGQQNAALGAWAH
jgi:hypothetical protein